MKASELRIGNIMNAPEHETLISPRGLFYVDIGALTSISNGNVYTFEAVPLTEEWLVKFGFLRSPENDCVFANGVQAVFFDKTDSFCELKGAYPKYVHQLQNLYFALTGEELTLK
jgi:hypothetical protein